jgi:hypothetical protein
MLLVACGCALAADADFPLGVYWPWERVCGNAERLKMDKWAYVDSRLDHMQRHHVDSVWVVNLNIADLGPLAKKLEARKMTLIPALGELHYNLEWRRNNWEYLEKESKRALQAAGESPAVIAWALCDEPRKNIVGEMEQFRQKFIEWGAKQRPVTVTMWPDSPLYARETKFPVLCTDIYPFFADGNPNGPNPAEVSKRWYRKQVEMTVREAKEAGKTPWVMPQMFCDVWGTWKYDAKNDMVILPGGVMHWRAPTVAETRWQLWAAIGAGAQGIYWYVYEPCVNDNAEKPAYTGKAFPEALIAKQEQALHTTGGLVRRDGSATPQYDAAGEAHAAVEKLLPLLKGCVPVDIWPVQVSAPGWVGMLQNPASKRTFVAVVNDDCEKAQELTLTTADTKLRDLRTGRLLRVKDGKALVRLEAGEGTVLEVAE